MIESASNIYELVELRELMESDEYGIECALEMSCMLSDKEIEYGL